jgi:hypothetical protein
MSDVRTLVVIGEAPLSTLAASTAALGAYRFVTYANLARPIANQHVSSMRRRRTVPDHL